MFGVDPKVTFFPVAAERRILTITSVGTLVMASSGVVHDCMIHGCHCHASGVDTTNSSYRSITKIPNHKLSRDTLFSNVSIPRDKHPHGRLFIAK